MLDLKKSFDRLVVIEGSDGSGKTVQSALLCDYLKRRNYDVHLLDFPDYESKTGELVKAMLRGEFGDDAAKLNPYFTSPMYGIDRFQKLKKVFEENKFEPMDIGICNRYTMSNLIHQGARIRRMSDFKKYYEWLANFEFECLGLPEPICTIYLELPFEVSRANIIKRSEHEGTEIDINETEEYLSIVSKNVERIKMSGFGSNWHFINCYDQANGIMRPVNDIHDEIVDVVFTAFKIAETVRSHFD